MVRLIKAIENPPEGTPLQYLGVYVTRWRSEMGEPTMGFVEDENVDELLDACRLLVKQYGKSDEPFRRIRKALYALDGGD